MIPDSESDHAGRSPWAAGVYWNPDDPRLIVRKRRGFGWTLNFARPAAWVILLNVTWVSFAGLYLGRSSDAHIPWWAPFLAFLPLLYVGGAVLWRTTRPD